MKDSYKTNPHELITHTHGPFQGQTQTFVSFPIALYLIPGSLQTEFCVFLFFLFFFCVLIFFCVCVFFIVLPHTHTYTQTYILPKQKITFVGFFSHCGKNGIT